MSSYKDLKVWQKGIDLVKEVYSIVKLLPTEEKYALSDQLRRASVSIPSNIAEGYGRNAKKDYIRFLNISLGSVYETETQLIICKELNYLSENELKKSFDLCLEIQKMLNVLINKIYQNTDL